MPKKWTEHPTYKEYKQESEKIKEANELYEAKKAAGVSSETEALERAYDQAVKSGDKKLQENLKKKDSRLGQIKQRNLFAKNKIEDHPAYEDEDISLKTEQDLLAEGLSQEEFNYELHRLIAELRLAKELAGVESKAEAEKVLKDFVFDNAKELGQDLVMNLLHPLGMKKTGQWYVPKTAAELDQVDKDKARPAATKKASTEKAGPELSAQQIRKINQNPDFELLDHVRGIIEVNELNQKEKGICIGILRDLRKGLELTDKQKNSLSKIEEDYGHKR